MTKENRLHRLLDPVLETVGFTQVRTTRDIVGYPLGGSSRSLSHSYLTLLLGTGYLWTSRFLTKHFTMSSTPPTVSTASSRVLPPWI